MSQTMCLRRYQSNSGKFLIRVGFSMMIEKADNGFGPSRF